MAKDEAPNVEEVEAEQETITLTQNITIPQSAVTLDSKSMADPRLLQKEEAKQKELAAKRKKNRVAKIKAKPRTPIQVRKAILAARLRKVKNRQSHTYRKEQLIAWAKEYEIIQNRPKSWSQGCVRAKKKKTAQDFIDELNID